MLTCVAAGDAQGVEADARRAFRVVHVDDEGAAAFELGSAGGGELPDGMRSLPGERRPASWTCRSPTDPAPRSEPPETSAMPPSVPSANSVPPPCTFVVPANLSEAPVRREAVGLNVEVA